MRRYFARKLVTYILTFVVAVTVDWMIPRFMPGNPVSGMLARMNLQPDAADRMMGYFLGAFGLNHPLWQQYLNFWVALFHGDLGISVWLFPRPVTDVIMSALAVHARAARSGDPIQLGCRKPVRRVCRTAKATRQHRPAGRLHPDCDAVHVARDPARLGARVSPEDLPVVGRLSIFRCLRRSHGSSSSTRTRTGSCRSSRSSWSCSAAGRSACGT